MDIYLDRECDCPDGFCESGCDNPLDCVLRLKGEVMIKTCEICREKKGCSGTWHHEGICLACKHYDSI